jgi:hypothetical protein
MRRHRPLRADEAAVLSGCLHFHFGLNAGGCVHPLLLVERGRISRPVHRTGSSPSDPFTTRRAAHDFQHPVL